MKTSLCQNVIALAAVAVIAVPLAASARPARHPRPEGGNWPAPRYEFPNHPDWSRPWAPPPCAGPVMVYSAPYYPVSPPVVYAPPPAPVYVVPSYGSPVYAPYGYYGPPGRWGREWRHHRHWDRD